MRKKVAILSLIFFISNIFSIIDVEAISISSIILIKNAGFESEMNNWGVWNANGNLKTSIDTTQKNEGQQSIKMSNGGTQAGRGTVAQVLENMNSAIGKKLVLTQSFKSENLKGNGVKVRVRLLDAQSKQIGDMLTYNIELPEISNWTDKVIEIAVPNNQDINNIEVAYMYDYNIGNLWIDKISGVVKEIDTGIIKNAGFESEMNNWGVWNANGNLKTSIDTTQKNEGQQSIKMSNGGTQAGRGTVAQVLENMNSAIGKKLVLTQSFKSENLKGNGVKVRVRLLDAQSKQIGDMLTYNIELPEISNWTDKVIEIAVPNNQDINKIEVAYMYDYNTGNLWIDKIMPTIMNSGTIISNAENVLLGNENETIEGILKITQEYKAIHIVSTTKNGKFEIDDNGLYKYYPNEYFYGYDECQLNITQINGTTKNEKLTIYVAPSVYRIENSINNSNPRIMINKNKIEELKLGIKSDNNLSRWYEMLKTNNEKILSSDCVPYRLMDGLRLDTTAAYYITNMSFMYKLTDNKLYLDRALKEIDNVMNTYKDWNPNHLLDTSELSLSFALAYDWLNEDIDNYRKEKMKNNIIEKSLNIANELYNTNSPTFVTNNLNWNIINNSSFIISALSIYNGDNLSASVIQNGFKSLQNSILTYYDGGDTKEGLLYWEYATRHLVYLLDTLNTSMNIENSFMELPGLGDTGDFMMSMSGTNGIFNYYDAENDNYVGGDVALWMAKKFNKPHLLEYSKFYKDKVKYITPFDLIWYDSNLNNNEESNSQLDYIFNKT